MKYCLPYNKYTYKNELINEADEWTIDYNPDDITLTKFLDVYKDKRINFRIKDNVNIEEELGINFLKELNEKYPNLYIQFPQYYFFTTYANNIDFFYILLNSGVSDIYVVESLCFELDKISKMAKEKNIRIRTYPNVAQTLSSEIPALKRFFIRPEDIQIYEKYVDVCEFLYENEACLVYLDIYKNKKEWFGNLAEIIDGLEINLDSRFILPKFGETRVKCGKRCFRGDPCHICELIQETAETLEDAGIRIDKEEKDNG